MQKAQALAILSDVRKALALSLLLVPVFCANAQEQERKLVDRIMKPDMTLENDSQTKKFTADRTSVDKQAHVSTFYVQEKSTEKHFHGTRDFSAGRFDARNFNQPSGATADNLAAEKARSSTYADASKTLGVHSVHDQNKSKASRDYAGNRAFTEQGKSQKSLNRKNKPMTIDDVRELLNKNK